LSILQKKSATKSEEYGSIKLHTIFSSIAYFTIAYPTFPESQLSKVHNFDKTSLSILFKIMQNN